jgi:hypothetical protein
MRRDTRARRARLKPSRSICVLPRIGAMTYKNRFAQWFGARAK